MKNKLLDLPGPLPEYRGKGKVLRVKTGYNPNSSSLGSVVFSIPALLVAVPALLAGVAAFIASRKGLDGAQEADKEATGDKKA